MTNWEKLYESCLSERDPDELTSRIMATEDAILERSLALTAETNGRAERRHDERQQMSYALSKLLTLMFERIGWPGISSQSDRNPEAR